MTRPVFLLCALALVAACDNGPLRLPPPTRPAVVVPPPAPEPPPPPAPAPSPRVITVGEEVRGRFTGVEAFFELTAPVSGVLTARLNWDVWFNGTLLVLKLEDAAFKGAPPDWAPVTGTLRVTAGGKYRLAVAGGGTDWFYDDEFVLITSID